MIGALDQVITLQDRTFGSDGAGGQLETWADLDTDATVFARVVATAGGERDQGDRLTAQSRYIFTIRNRTDLDERMRISWEGETYQIRSIRRFGAREMYLKIDAERGAVR